MEKPTSLRAAIAAAAQEYARDAERLQMWVEEGHIRSPMTASRGFEWKYRLNITLTDCTTHPSVLFLAIMMSYSVTLSLLKPRPQALASAACASTMYGSSTDSDSTNSA